MSPIKAYILLFMLYTGKIFLTKWTWPSGKRLTAVSTALGSILFGHPEHFK